MNLSTMTPVNQAEYAALTQGAALVDYAAEPSPSDVLLLSDADRHDFLHRMTTNNINALRPGQSAVTVLTSPTARILFVFTVLARAADLLLLPAPGQGAALARHLRGQIFFMDKVRVRDEGGNWARLRLTGPRAGEVLAALGVPAVEIAPNAWLEAHGLITLAQPDYGLPGYEVLVPAAGLADVHAELVEAGALPVSPAAAEARRIELGRPAPGAELTDAVNPLEAGLAWACADNKGCYTGQEIIARQITYDKVTKQLVGLRSATLLAPGSEVMVEGRDVGVVTSVTLSPALAAPLALAILKRPYQQAGTAVQVDGHDAQVAALPFVASPA